MPPEPTPPTTPPLTLPVTLTVNGADLVADVSPRQTLAEVLRDTLGLTGTHLGCEQGVCGACTVVLDGAAVRSCLVLAAQADQRSVTTVEGLTPEPNAGLHPLQQAFWDHQGLQCGFCTPGFLMTAVTAVAESPCRTRGEWRERLAGNLCRCTGYESIIDAVTDYAGTVAPAESDPAPEADPDGR